MSNTLPSPRQIARDINPVVPGKTGEAELQHDLAGALRPVMASLGFFQPLQLATDMTSTWESSGPTASSARMTRSFAAMTSSRKDAASSGAPRRDLPEGAGADQFAVTLGLSLANQ